MEEDYESVSNLIRHEVEKGNIYIIGIVCRDQDKYCSVKDGYQVVSHNELKRTVDFDTVDFVVICNRCSQQAIRTQLQVEFFVERKKILGFELFHLSCFNFELYAELIKKPVSILCNDFLGGQVYRDLGLPYSSPLIWTAMQAKDFARLLINPQTTLYSNLELISDTDPVHLSGPVASMGIKGPQALFCREPDFKCAKADYERRLKRVNQQRMVVLFNPKEEDYLQYPEIVKALEVSGLPYCAFSARPGIPNTLHSIRNVRNKITESNYHQFIREKYLNLIDVFKFLNGLPDFVRDIE